MRTQQLIKLVAKLSSAIPTVTLAKSPLAALIVQQALCSCQMPPVTQLVQATTMKAVVCVYLATLTVPLVQTTLKQAVLHVQQQTLSCQALRVCVRLGITHQCLTLCLVVHATTIVQSVFLEVSLTVLCVQTHLRRL